MDWLAAPDLWLARWLFTRALGVVYAIAFLTTLLQWRPLLGRGGLLPVTDFLRRTSFRRYPSVFHLRYSDGLATALAASGLALSALLVVGLPQQGPVWLHGLAWLAVWALYQSFVNVGQIWYAFGWESILLEAGFFAAFLGTDDAAPPFVAILLLRWLLFRVEFGAGLIKLRGDQCWRDLTCLEYHHETQPLPGPLSWRAHRLPRWWHRTEVLGNYVAQLVMPIGLFLPQPVATVSGLVIIITQGWLVLTGNFAWLNVVTIVLAVTALDAGVLGWLPVDVPAGVGAASIGPTWFAWLVIAVGATIAVMSWWPLRNMASRSQRMNASFNPLHLVGTYGAFGSVTRQRLEVAIEGSPDPEAGPAAEWREFGFKGKPGPVDRRPPLIAPYHLRLDWLMWFAAMSSPVQHAWFPNLLAKLLADDEGIKRLLGRDPFPDGPPRTVRAILYHYRFTTPDERRETRTWWVRRRVDEYFPPVRLAEGQLVRVPRDVWPRRR